MGKYGSPGRVASEEILHSVLIRPSDFDNEQLAITLVTHAEKKGMSVLRGAASNEEFEATIRLRRGDKQVYLAGFSLIPCDRVRDLLAVEDDGQYQQRLYFVLDTDEPDRPHHAEIFSASTVNKVRKARRLRLLEIVANNISSPEHFRNGVFDRPEWTSP